MLRHKALGFTWRVPVFGEEVGMWRSHDKKHAKSAHNKGAIGRLIGADPWVNRTCTLIAKGTDIQDLQLVNGLQPKTVAVDCLRLSKPAVTPEGWSKDAMTTLAHQWKTIQTPEGKDLGVRLDSGHTQYSSPFTAEVESATATVSEDAKQAFWGEVTEPGNDIVRTEVVEFNPPQCKPAQA